MSSSPSSSSHPTHRMHHAEEVMGTIVTIDLFGDESVPLDEIDPYVQFAVASLHEADDVFSLWKAASPMSRVRRGELELADAPGSLREVLDACRGARDLSQGWFDPWILPGGVDPTGYVKGWAAQRALHLLAAAPVRGAIVNAAGDVATFGRPTPQTAFRVGITDPADTQSLCAVVELGGCIATSGRYERGDHLVDPFSGELTARLASASVTGPELGMADALATALCVAGNGLLQVIEGIDEFEAFTITDEGERRWTAGFPLAALAAPVA